MKKSIFITALAAFFAFTSCKDNAGENANEENMDNVENMEVTGEVTADNAVATGDLPVMTFDKADHDFGTLDQGTNVEHLFTFTNTGKAPLVITNAKGSCGCTVPTFTKDPIAPGAKGEMLVKFNGSGQNQRVITVNIDTNTAAGKEKVTIRAFVNPKEGAATASNIRATNTTK